MREYTAIIPTLNAAGVIDGLIGALEGQSLPPREILVVDSASDDDTVAIAKRHRGARVIGIDRRDFDHGGTRDMAVRACDAPFMVLLTQDALPVGKNWAEALIGPFEDSRVSAVCGRQIARTDARAAEKAVRAYRYPGESRVWDEGDIPALGMRAFLLSDVCAAYRRDAYLAVGGFEHPIETNEDMLIAAALLGAGYRLAYSAEAAVWHSHDHTLRQEYERNRRIGRFLARYGDRFGSETGEGLKMAKAVALRLIREGQIGEALWFGCDCAARLLGNRRGKRDKV